MRALGKGAVWGLRGEHDRHVHRRRALRRALHALEVKHLDAPTCTAHIFSMRPFCIVTVHTSSWASTASKYLPIPAGATTNSASSTRALSSSKRPLSRFPTLPPPPLPYPH